MNTERTDEEYARELRTVLVRLVKRMTGHTWSNSRLMQMDVGEAVALLGKVDFPSSIIVQRALPDLMREVAYKKPDLHRFIIALEDAARDLAERSGPPKDEDEDEPWKA